HRTGQSVSDVARHVSWDKVTGLAEPDLLLNRAPTRVQSLKRNHVARVDRQRGCQLTGKISVHRPRCRVQMMLCHVCSALPPALFRQASFKGSSLRLSAEITRQKSSHQHCDTPLLFALLRACRERPCCRAAKERDEIAPLHSITSSARATRVLGKLRPIARAALRLIDRVNFSGSCTGSSAGRAPRRMRST